MTDIKSRAIFRLSLTDRILQKVITSPLEGGDPFKPRWIQRLGNDTIVESGVGNLVWLDSNYDRKGQVDLVGVSNKQEGTIESVWAWIRTEDDVFGIVDLEVAKDAWEAAVVRIPWDAPQHFVVLHTFDSNARSFNLARLGLPMFASLGERVFLLWFEGSGGVYEVTTGFQRRANLFEEIQLPPIPDSFPEDLAEAYRIVERSTMPAGIYSTGDKLFLLNRRPRSGGMTTWSLAQVDLGAGQCLYSRSLYTTSPHLVVIPGLDRWAIVEKGPVSFQGSQPVQAIHRILLVQIDPSMAQTEMRTAP
jgi:hypothetical protein